MTEYSSLVLNLQIPIFTKHTSLITPTFSHKPLSFSNHRSSKYQSIQISRQTQATTAAMEVEGSTDSSPQSMNHLLFVEMGVGYDQHGQDITSAAMRACRDAISSNSIPAFRRGNIYIYILMCLSFNV
jgi:hypothetical protein